MDVTTQYSIDYQSYQLAAVVDVMVLFAKAPNLPK